MTYSPNRSEFATWGRSPLLVLVDLQREAGEVLDPALDEAIARCRVALNHARATSIPVAFVRRLRGAGRAPHGWLDGFMPSRQEMLFERHANTCYASEYFAEKIEAVGRDCVLAGLYGDTSCVATIIDAANRGHRVTYLSDASYSHGRGGFSASEIHGALSSVLGLHALVETTQEWTEQVWQERGKQ